MSIRPPGDPSRPPGAAIEDAIERGSFSEAAELFLASPASLAPTSVIERIANGLAERATNEAQAERFLWAAFQAHPDSLPIKIMERRRLLRGDRAGAEAVIAEGLSKLPDDRWLLVSSARMLVGRKAFLEAAMRLQKALQLVPDDLEARAMLAFVNAYSGDLETGIDQLFEVESLAPPLATPTLAGVILYSEARSAREIFEVLLRRGAQLEASCEEMTKRVITERPQRLKVGYVSADFRQHSVAYFIEPLLRCHDRRRFDIHAYHTRPGGDEITRRIAALDIGFHDVSALDNHQLAMRIREDEIDILVDLGGHTEHSRIATFAYRPAPIQVSYLGYAATTGLSVMDARLTDSVADPIGISDDLHTEKLIRLPGCAWCFAPPVESPDVVPRKNGPITFGSFNALMKIGPSVVRLWANVLQSVSGSRLFLKAAALSRRDAVERMVRLFAEQGIESDRLTLRGWESDGLKHLEAYHAVDIALDPFPYNGTTTTCEALWMGVPVITLEGDRHAARVGASLLSASGMSDWVARTPESYVAIACAQSRDLERLGVLRMTLRKRLRDSALCDAPSFAGRVEAAYDDLFSCQLAGTLRLVGLDEAARLLALAKTSSHDQTHLSGHFARRALATLPGHFDLAMMTARSDEAAGNLARAERALSQAVESSARESASRVADSQASLSSTFSAVDALPELARIRGLLGDSEGKRAALSAWVTLSPESAEAHVMLATALRNAGLTGEAGVELEAALRIAPSHPRALMLAGILEMSWGKPELGLPLLERAVAADPSDSVISSNLLYGCQFGSNTRQEVFRRHLLHGVRHAASRERPIVVARLSRDMREPGRKLRIGYLSADFREHSIARFIEGILRQHDRRRFHITLYASVRDPDSTTLRLQSSADQTRFVQDLSDWETAALIDNDGVDILVELGGHSAKSRLGVLAFRPAMARVSYLGYPDTTGISSVDYKLTDELVDPIGDSEPFHIEKLVRLSLGAWCFDPRPDTPAVRARPRDGKVVFGSFNDIAKVTDEVLSVWAQVLSAVPESRLLLKGKFAADAQVVERARRVFDARGIEATRVELRYGSSDIATHLDSYGEVDIALDPFPYCGTTTTCEALDMGVPVISLVGDRHVSRVGKSLLSRVGLGDLASSEVDEYLRNAVRLAGDVDRRAHLRATLRETFRSSIGDAAPFTEELERTYLDMATGKDFGGESEVPEARRGRARALVSEAHEALAASRLELAEVRAREAIANDPRSAAAHTLLGDVLASRENGEDAESAYRTAIALDANFYDAITNLGGVLSRRGDRASAIAMFERAVGIDPSKSSAHAQAAAAHRSVGRVGEAIASYERALAIAHNTQWSLSLAEMLRKNNELPRAERILVEALAAAPLDGHLKRAVSALKASDGQSAFAPVKASGKDQRAAELSVSVSLTDPADTPLIASLAARALAAGLFDLTVGAAQRGLVANPHAARLAWLAARAFDALGDKDAAEGVLDEALVGDADPSSEDLINCYLLLADVRSRRADIAGAERALRHVLAKAPHARAARLALARLLEGHGDLDRARDELAPLEPLAQTDALVALRFGHLEAARGEWEKGIRFLRLATESPNATPEAHSALLEALHYGPTPATEMFREHLSYGIRYGRRSANTPIITNSGSRPLRVGYLAADDRLLPFLVPLLREHDRSHVLPSLYISVATPAVKRDIATLCPIVETSGLEDRALAERFTDDRIDVLVDLGGHLSQSRIHCLAEGPAKVSVGYLGYPDTTGLDSVARITDAVVDPPLDDENLYLESLIRLERVALSFDPFSGAPEPSSRIESRPFTLGAFHSMATVGPDTLSLWAELLKATGQSQLVIFSASNDSGLPARIGRALSEHDVDPSRIEIRSGPHDQLQRWKNYEEVDLALDSLHWGSVREACEAMWMGTPVLTLEGNRASSRLTTSVLDAIGLRELSAKDTRALVTRATKLSEDRARLRSIGSSLRSRIASSPLTDVVGFTRAFESALASAWTLARDRSSSAASSNSAPSAPRAELSRRLVAESTELLRQKRVDQALMSAHHALAADPQSAEAHNALGNALVARGDDVGAESHYEASRSLDLGLFKPLNNLGNLRAKKGDNEAAAALFQSALTLNPAAFRVHANLANALRALGRKDEALLHFEKSLAISPNVIAFQGVADLFQSLGRYDQALSAVEHGLRLSPGSVELTLRRVECLFQLGSGSEAEDALGALRARDSATFSAREEALVLDALIKYRMFDGAARWALRQSSSRVSVSQLRMVAAGLTDTHGASAADRFLLEVAEARNSAEALDELDERYRRRKDWPALEGALRERCRRFPGLLEGKKRLAIFLDEHRFHTEAARLYQEIITRDPRDLESRARLAILKSTYGYIDESLATLKAIEHIRPDLNASFALLEYSDRVSRQELFDSHLAAGREVERNVIPVATSRGKPARQRIRVGYVSADFREHSVASFMLPILRHHDKTRFEVFAYHLVEGGDHVTKTIASLDLHFVEASGLDDDALAARIVGDDIDVLVDLGGYTKNARLGLFARHPGRVQVSYLGYANTTGLRSIEYRITDEKADPPGDGDHFHTERLVRLADSAWCFEPPVGAPLPARRDRNGITFGSFNPIMKLTPRTVKTWSAILHRVPSAKLMLKAWALQAEMGVERVHALFAEHQIGSDRLILRGWHQDTQSHLAAYSEIDVALDPFPYNGTTTTCEALWMGVPVVTLAGDRHAGRVGVSLLASVGLSDLVGSTREDYANIAVRLAANRGRLIALRAETRQRLSDSALGNARLFVPRLERAYMDMLARLELPGSATSSMSSDPVESVPDTEEPTVVNRSRE